MDLNGRVVTNSNIYVSLITKINGPIKWQVNYSNVREGKTYIFDIFDILSTIDMLLIKLRPKTKIISNTNKVLLVI